jgi:hypothetical protein
MRSAAVARDMFRAAAPRCTPKGFPCCIVPSALTFPVPLAWNPVPGFWSVGLAGGAECPMYSVALPKRFECSSQFAPCLVGLPIAI